MTEEEEGEGEGEGVNGRLARGIIPP